MAKRQRVVYKQQSKQELELEPANANTDVARRIEQAYGTEWLRLMRTFQKHFDAKLIYHEDEHGTVGKKPNWASVD